MQLQLAIDRVESLAIVSQVADLVDILEVGTPLLKRLGLAAIATVRELAPGLPIIADTKTVDAGLTEADMVFGCGASMLTVLSCAAIQTHAAAAAAAAAARHGGAVIIDFINHIEGLERLAGDMSRLPANLVIHSPTDLRLAGGQPALDYVDLRRRVGALGCAVGIAGGIGPGNLGAVLDADPDVIVVGSAITESPDPRGAAQWIASQLTNRDRGWRLASS